MHFKGLVCGKARKVKTKKGFDVKVNMKIKGEMHNVDVPENFPRGLIADRGPLDGKELDVFLVSQKDKNKGKKYELLGWNNQHDSIKAELMMNLIHGISKSLLDTIPWEEDIKENLILREESIEILEKIYRSDLENKNDNEETSENNNL